MLQTWDTKNITSKVVQVRPILLLGLPPSKRVAFLEILALLSAWTMRVRGSTAMLVGKAEVKMGICRMESIASKAKEDRKTYQR